MIPYLNSFILDTTSNYGIVETESVFDFSRPIHANFLNSSLEDMDFLHWNLRHEPFEARTLKEKNPTKPSTITTKLKGRGKNIKKMGKKLKKKHNHNKMKKCILKLYKKNKKHKHIMMKSKYILPLLLGLFAVKSLFTSIALKALTFISVMGLLMGIFSTALASILSLKGILDHSNRKDDTKTLVEIIQIPPKNEDHYYNEHYSRGDYVPMVNNQL